MSDGTSWLDETTNPDNSRTMVAEVTKEKKYQSRAFLILPMSFNVAGILGPSKLPTSTSSDIS